MHTDVSQPEKSTSDEVPREPEVSVVEDVGERA